MIILAESGSTKTEWCLINKNGIVEQCFTDGINPSLQTRKEISHIVRLQLPPAFFKLKVSSIFFYGGGCLNAEKKNIVKTSFETQLKTPTIIESDLLGAARSLFRNKGGIACILDNVSNSCFFDGTNIVKNVKPLGYILGDEGSGTSLGKIFLADCLKELAPRELIEQFYDKYKINPDEILDYIYSKPYPDRLLAILSSFLSDHIEHPYVSDIVYNNLKSFFERNILQYDYKSYPVRFVGKVAYSNIDIVKKIANEYGIYIDKITENPIAGLMEYHIEKRYF